MMRNSCKMNIYDTVIRNIKNKRIFHQFTPQPCLVGNLVNSIKFPQIYFLPPFPESSLPLGIAETVRHSFEEFILLVIFSLALKKPNRQQQDLIKEDVILQTVDLSGGGSPFIEFVSESL